MMMKQFFGIEDDDKSTSSDNNMWSSPPRSTKHRVTNNRGRDTITTDMKTQRTHRRNESLDKLRLLSASHQQTNNKVAMPGSGSSSSKVNNVQRDRKDNTTNSVERVGNVSITIDKRTQQYSDTSKQQQQQPSTAIDQLQQPSLQSKAIKQKSSSLNEKHPKHSSYAKLELVADSDDDTNSVVAESANDNKGHTTKSKRSTLRNVIRSVSPLSSRNNRMVSPTLSTSGSSNYTKDGKELLPPGWKQTQDINTKQVYYYHLDGRVSWDFPLQDKKKKSKRGSSLTRKKKGRQSRNVTKREGSRGRSKTSSVTANNDEGRRRASSFKATSRYSSIPSQQSNIYQRHSSLSLNHDEKNDEQQHERSTSQEVEKRVTFQDDHSQQQKNQGRGRSRPTSPTSFFPLRNRQHRKRSASPSIIGRRLSDLSRSLSPTRIGGCAMNLGNSGSPTSQSISSYASSLVTLPSSVSNLLLFQCGGGGGGGLGNAALGNGSKEDVDDKDLDEGNELLEEAVLSKEETNKKTTIDGGDSLKVPIVRVDSLLLKSDTEDTQEEQEVCTTIERSYSTPIPSLLDGVEDGEGESEVHHRGGHRRTMSGSINKLVKGKGSKASNRSLEALNLMKSRVKKSRLAVQPPKMKTKSSSSTPSSAPPLAHKSHRRSTSWGRSSTTRPLKRFSHRRTMSTGGGNVFPSMSSSLAAQSSSLTRSASFSSGLPKSSAAAAAVDVDDDSSALPQATTPSDRGIADNTSTESPSGVDDDLNLLTHENKFLAEVTKTTIPTPPLNHSRGVPQSNFLQDYHLKRGHRINMKSDMTTLSMSPSGESSRIPLNLDEILKSSTTKETEFSTRKKKKSVATLMSTNSSIVELALIEKENTDGSEDKPVVANSRGDSGNSLLDKDIDAAATHVSDDDDDDKSISAEALSSEEDDDDLSPVVVPETQSPLDSSTRDLPFEAACESKDSGTPEVKQQECDDAILMLKSRAKQRGEDTPTKCQSPPPPARWPPVKEEQTTLKYSITRESDEKGEDDSILSSSSAPSESDNLPAVYMNDEHDMRSTSTNSSSKFHKDIEQVSTVVSVNSMSAIYSQDENKMFERETCTRYITKRDINTLNDFDSIAVESELTADTVFDTHHDVPTVKEMKSIVTAQQQGPMNDKKFDPSHYNTTTQDCNYSTTLDTAYENFGIERQLAIVDENGRKTRQGMKLRLIKPRNFGLPWKPNKPVDVDETSFATSLADNSVKSTNSNDSDDDEEVGQLDWVCGDMCGNEEDIVNDEYTAG